MMTPEQRELAYLAIGYIERTHSRAYADALRAALREVDEAREVALELATADARKAAPVPETYAYWLGVSYVTRDGAQALSGMRVVRSTPLLTAEDITTAAEMIRAQHGFDRCAVLGVYPLAGE